MSAITRNLFPSSIAPLRRVLQVHNGLVPGNPTPYVRGWAYQTLLLQERLRLKREGKESKDSVLLFEHEHVYTLGRGADERHLAFMNGTASEPALARQLQKGYQGPDSIRLAVNRATMDRLAEFGCLDTAVDSICENAPSPYLAPQNKVPIYRVERGGEVTYHGPGQLIVYPMMDLQADCYKKDLRWFLRQIEQVVIDTLAEFGVEGTRDEINTGVWVGANKIAAVGLTASRWITTHGFAINISPQLSYFDTEFILPCGIEGRGVTSLEQELDPSKLPSIDTVGKVVLEKMELVFDVDTKSETRSSTELAADRA